MWKLTASLINRSTPASVRCGRGVACLAEDVQSGGWVELQRRLDGAVQTGGAVIIAACTIRAASPAGSKSWLAVGTCAACFRSRDAAMYSLAADVVLVS